MQKDVKVEMVPGYILTIDGEAIPGFVKTSTWEGFAKFEHPHLGAIILSSKGPDWESQLSEVIQRIFAEAPEPADMQIMKISPLMLDLMKTLGMEEEEGTEGADTTEAEEL